MHVSTFCYLTVASSGMGYADTPCAHISLGLPVFTLAAHIYMRTMHFCCDSAVIVSGGVSYLDRREGDFCLMCVSQLTIVHSVTVLMLCGWGKGVGLKAYQY